MRDILLNECSANKETEIDVLKWLSRTTLDVIGLAGFNYKFNALNAEETPNELSTAFNSVFDNLSKRSVLAFLQLEIPYLRHLVRIMLHVSLKAFLDFSTEFLGTSAQHNVGGQGYNGTHWKGTFRAE